MAPCPRKLFHTSGTDGVLGRVFGIALWRFYRHLRSGQSSQEEWGIPSTLSSIDEGTKLFKLSNPYLFVLML